MSQLRVLCGVHTCSGAWPRAYIRFNYRKYTCRYRLGPARERDTVCDVVLGVGFRVCCTCTSCRCTREGTRWSIHRRLHVWGMLGSDRRGWVFVMGWVSVMGWGSELWSVVCGLWSVVGDQWSVVGDQSKTSGAVKQRWTW